ncbi:MAG: SWIM zinc finger family protein, partial [Acidimicrobiia bacterium]
MGWGYYDFRPYVSVAERRAQAAKEVAKRAKAGKAVAPVRIEGRAIASTFWGKAWCENLEGYSDFENRLPRGRTYVRNGSVVDLKIESGRITALVSGSELYDVRIDIAALPKPQWQALKAQCVGQVGTLVELLQGKLSKAVMERVTDRAGGLFPKPKEITMRCSCPDYAGMCKHVAATMYGVGNRLDSAPELLFVLRGVDHKELIEQAIPAAPVGSKSGAPAIAAGDLGAIFGIDIGDAPPPPAAKAQARDKPATKTSTKKVAVAKKAAAAPKK